MAKIVGKNIGDVPGTIKDIGGGTLEPGYLLCDGTSYLVATYPVLFSKIGYTWGGAGANFNVPNFRGRGRVNAGNYTDPVSGSVTRVLGASAGAEAHVITIAQMAAHAHGGAVTGGGTHTHTMKFSNGGGGLGVEDTGDAGGSFTTGIPSGTAEGSHGHGISSEGSSNSHNNMQPYSVVTMMIKF